MLNKLAELFPIGAHSLLSPLRQASGKAPYHRTLLANHATYPLAGQNTNFTTLVVGVMEGKQNDELSTTARSTVGWFSAWLLQPGVKTLKFSRE